jgi:hypothetical protein
MSIFDELFDHLRRERNRCIQKRDVKGARALIMPTPSCGLRCWS